VIKKLRKMREKLNPFHNPNNTFSISDIKEMLENKGISQTLAKGSNLNFIYKKLKWRPHGPDLKIIDNILNKSTTIDPDETTPLWGLILETRNHPFLELVINNFVAKLNIPVQLFHGTGNENFINTSALSKLIEEGKLVLTNLGVGQLNAPQYNALFISDKFWQSVRGRNKILVFQTDTITCPKSDYSISDFMQFDYIGSKWPKLRPVGIEMDGGNGGLSLRDWKQTVECIKRFPPKNWKAGEDGYFAFHLDIMGANIGRDIDCAKFSTQHEFLFNSFGAHKISTLDKDERTRFLEYCPEAKHML
jgi:hypothetical protein